jgi:hypothetical protein
MHIPMLKLYILLYLSITWQVLISRHSKITTSVFSRLTQKKILQSSSSLSRAAVLILFYVWIKIHHYTFQAFKT